jgi:hypothetical protein
MSQIKVKKSKSTILEKFKVKKNEFLKLNLPKVIKYSARYLRKVNGVNNYENPDNLEDFSPVILTKDEDKHSELIKYAVDNHNVLNLALTGPLGSGKSSILKTFENKYFEYKCLNISLAAFDEKEPEIETIEHNILKQLFYSVEHKKIPESRFKRIENHKGILLKTILFLFWLISLSYFLDVNYFDELKKALFVYRHNTVLSFIYGVYFMIYSSFLVHKLMTFIINIKLTKFKFKDVDFDNNEDKKTINFENEIDEILYFFEKNPVEIVFIQDIDRFKNKSEIFIKLREINNLINNYEPIKKLRKVTFIYAVSDDIFKKNERAKFFDILIPVVPVINYTSSSSKFILKLDLDIESGKLSKGFIEDVSRFLNDYRTIKSIYNEYAIYKKIIGKQLDNYNNLLAMMIYKNIEPTDFEKLNSNQGYVYSIVQNLDELIEERIQNLNNKINLELNPKLEDVKNVKLKNVKELRMLYIFKFHELINSQNSYSVFGFYLNSTKVSLVNMVTDEYFDFFRNLPNINYYFTAGNTTASGISFSQIEKELDSSSYTERLEALENSEKEKLNQIKIELNEIENQKQDLNSKKLFELLDGNNSATYFAKHKTEKNIINNDKLINYLLRNGYINEDYNHYISYFHIGSITKEDNDYLISLIPSEKALPYNHKLKEIKSLIKQIKPENYNRESILNFSFIDYLIENSNNYELNVINNLLRKGNKKSIKFIDEYIAYSNENNRSEFFKILSKNWHELWYLIKSESNFTEEKIETYLKYIFKYLDLITIGKIDKHKKLSIHISELENLNCFNENEINVETLKKFIENSTVKFENLEYNEKHKILFEVIYENNKYELNEKMIELFITNFNKNGTITENLKTANYTTVKNSGKPKLIKYIDDHLEEYLENVFLKLEDNSNESQESICSILNGENIKIRFDIIEKIKFSIVDLSKINEIEIQSTLIRYEKINPTWKNLLIYYKELKEIDKTTIDYLNYKHNYSVLSKPPFIDCSDAAVKTSFSKDLIMSNISDESFSKLTYSLPFAYKDGNEFIGISDSRMKSLIESKRILLSKDNYTLIENKFNNLLIFILEKNANEFMKSIVDYTLNSSIILEIINSKAFNSSQKLSIIENTTDTILIDNKSLLLKLSEFLLANRINNISSVLLIELISNSGSEKNKVELTNKYFNFIESSDLSATIEKIEEFSKLLLGKRPKVDDTSYNQQLITNLEGKLISNKKVLKNSKQIELFPFRKSRI